MELRDSVGISGSRLQRTNANSAVGSYVTSGSYLTPTVLYFTNLKKGGNKMILYPSESCKESTLSTLNIMWYSSKL